MPMAQVSAAHDRRLSQGGQSRERLAFQRFSVASISVCLVVSGFNAGLDLSTLQLAFSDCLPLPVQDSSLSPQHSAQRAAHNMTGPCTDPYALSASITSSYTAKTLGNGRNPRSKPRTECLSGRGWRVRGPS